MSKQQIVFGIHAVEILLKKHPERILRLAMLETRQDKKIQHLLALAKNANIAIEPWNKVNLDRLVDDANHQGVVAFCVSATTYQENNLKELLENLTEPPFLLILDGVQDPHNLGACFRTADAAGVHAIIAPKDKSVGITPVVSKVACGATETVPFIQVTNLARTLTELKEAGVWLFGAAGEAEQSLFQADLRGPIAIIMGAEGEGLRRLTRETCDVLLRIPMYGTVESLNVSVATGIFLYTALRQRRT